MAGFNSMPALSSGAPPGPDAMAMTASDMDAFNACMAFDESLLDPVNIPPMPFTPTPYDFETFSTTFEDPFSYPARPFEPPNHNNSSHGGGSGGRGPPHTSSSSSAAAAAADTRNSHHDVYGHMLGGASPQADDDDDDAALDNKLLGFGAPIPGKASLLLLLPDSGSSHPGSQGQFVEPAMTGELYGMFFVAEDVFGAESNTSGRPLELTCYRRNLWQISGQVTLPRQVGALCYVDEQGRRVGVAELAASVTAVESIEGRVAEMITIPWRGSNAPMGAEETKAVGAPPVVPLDFVGGGQEVDGGSRVSVPVAWKRLQFKHATANNGRRKGLQQHYVVQINLLVRGKGGGEYVKVAEIQSGPVIVRGRSPRNFDSRKEVPLGDKRPLERRSTEGAGGAVVKQQRQDEGDMAKIQRYNAIGVQPSPSDWATPYASTPSAQPHPNKKMAITSPSLNRPPVPSWGSLDAPSSSANPKHTNNTKPPTTKQRSNSTTGPQLLPITLSLSEDERSPPNRSSSNDSAQGPQLTKSGMLLSTGGSGTGLTAPGQQAGGAHNPLASPLETEDMLYEYFPLSLDDWMPPVDAIYRPHVVHHTIVPPEVKAQQVRSKAKRYFAAE